MDKIAELAQLADKLAALEVGSTDDYNSVRDQLFAKLIVLNCAAAVESAVNIDLENPEIYMIESFGFGTERGAVNWWFDNKHLMGE